MELRSLLARRIRRQLLPALTTFVGYALGGVAVVVALLYVLCPVYREPAAQPFSGASWYNPYDSAQRQSIGVAGARADSLSHARWLDANFHAHSHAWGYASNVAQPAPDVLRAYRALGYDVVGISDYHTAPTSQPAGTFPVYEHGWNVQKAHRLVLGHSRVSFVDYPFGTGRNGRQHILDLLQSDSSLVAIAHPTLRDGHDAAMLTQLTGYDLLEVFNHFVPPADSEWDAVLSSGRAVWLLADDDSHNVDDSAETGVNRTRVFARDTSVNAMLAALRAGRAYGLHAVDAREPIRFDSVVMRGDTLSAFASGHVRALRIVGANGSERARVNIGDGARDTTAVLRYVASARDPYVRAMVIGPGDALVYANPVIRFNGRSVPKLVATIDTAATNRWRAECVAVCCWLAFWRWRVKRVRVVRRRALSSRISLH